MSSAACVVTLILGLCPLLAGADAPPPTPAEVAAGRQAFLKLIDRPRVELNAVEKVMSDAPPGMVKTQVSFDAEAGQRVPALFLRSGPADRGKRLPVVIVLHGTGSNKESNLPLMRTLASKGFLAVSPDGRYHGERRTDTSSPTADYFAAIARAFEEGKSHPWLYDTAYDVMRLIDYLQTRGDADPKRIGLVGFSKGGMETYLVAAADERVAAAAPLIGVQSYRWGLENDAWQARVDTVKGAAESAAKKAGVAAIDRTFAKRFYDRVVPGIDGEFDGPAVLPRIAPRPLLVVTGDRDANTPLPGVKLAAEAARAAYERAGAADRFELIVQPDTGHTVKPEALGRVVAWLVKRLEP
jgi:dienelactone hydrolase